MVLCLKKTLKASEQGREDIVQARREWKEFQGNTDPNHLVFLDESCAKTNLTRRYGRSFKGMRCPDSAPGGRWETVAVLSPLRLNGSTESVVFDGAVDRKIFDEYIKKYFLFLLYGLEI